MDNKTQIPKNFIFSFLLGIPFLIAWIGFTAVAAKDGREQITDWFDPMLAGLTLLAILAIQLVFMLLWPQLKDSYIKNGITFALTAAQWFYIFGEILSNTITIGEPPKDIGSLFEITAGVILFFASITLIGLYIKEQLKNHMKSLGARLLILLTIFLFFGMVWWFTHPIDQSEPGAPSYVEGNPIYNFFHGLW
ncbi:hypothetical protein [Metabacillus malikii]|uniref:MFS superfamily sulfate permease-like transporter n=1 Tax=Metabacillus malikii TaxID=1504265 RepID=A0ABT9ZF56_9BACI|nr:hypothetical protein [Metabacillus malikii]MDQ0230906.1 MFS superfamily sulfate permease-like transporter [Metabacillus malikii]